MAEEKQNLNSTSTSVPENLEDSNETITILNHGANLTPENEDRLKKMAKIMFEESFGR